MTQPRQYNQSTNFTDHSTVSPSDPHSGTNLDTEFVELKQNLDDLNANIALLQRDDGKLLNTAVHKDSFDQDALAFIGATGSGFTARGDWVTATDYVSGDLVNNNAATYLTVVATHTSGVTFAGDKATGKWTLIANSAIETSSASVNTHNGDGATYQFDTTYTYSDPGDIQVFVEGEIQPTAAYSVTNLAANSTTGNNITLLVHPPVGTNNVIIWGATVVAEIAKQQALIYRDSSDNHKLTANRFANLITGSVTDAESGAVDQGYSSKAYAIGGVGVTQTALLGAAKEWAIGTGRIDHQSTGGYSSKEHATGTTVAEGSAKEWATNAGSAPVDGSDYSSKAYAQDTGNDIGSSKDWAVLGTQVSSTDYSSKQYAVGTPPDGSAKEWATTDTAVVTGSLFSAKEYASGSSATGGTAKEWATKVDGDVDTTFSAKEYAQGTTAGTGGSALNWASQTGADITGGASGDKSAKSWASEEGANAPTDGSAKQWATLATTPSGTATDASAKEWATGTSTHKNDGSAKSWATITGAVVTGSEYSAKEYATGTTVATGSAKDWAVLPENSVVDGGTGYSSLHWAAKAAADLLLTNADVVTTAGYVDTFDDRYLGSHTTVYRETGTYVGKDNDLNALTDGALYFDTTLDVMKVWDDTGSVWKRLQPTTAEQTNIDTAVADAVDIGKVAAIDTEIGQVAVLGTAGVDVSTVAGLNTEIGQLVVLGTAGADISTVAALGTAGVDVSTVAGLNTQITLLGTSAMATAVTGHIAKVGSNSAELTRYATEYTISGSSPGSPQDGWLWSDTNSNLLKHYNGATSSWAVVSSTGISNVVDDETPQLGGDLDAQGNDITNMATISGTNMTIDFGTI